MQFNTTKTRSNKFRSSHLWLPITSSDSHERVPSEETTFKLKVCFLSRLHRHTTHITTAATAGRITHQKNAPIHITTRQGCTNPGCHVAVATEVRTVVPNICGPSLWNLLYFTLLLPIIRFLENLFTPGVVNFVWDKVKWSSHHTTIMRSKRFSVIHAILENGDSNSSGTTIATVKNTTLDHMWQRYMRMF